MHDARPTPRRRDRLRSTGWVLRRAGPIEAQHLLVISRSSSRRYGETTIGPVSASLRRQISSRVRRARLLRRSARDCCSGTRGCFRHRGPYTPVDNPDRYLERPLAKPASTCKAPIDDPKETEIKAKVSSFISYISRYRTVIVATLVSWTGPAKSIRCQQEIG